MSEFGDQLREEVQRIIDEPLPELPPSEPVRIETEGVFEPDLLDDYHSFLTDPMNALSKMLTKYIESLPMFKTKGDEEFKIHSFAFSDHRTVGPHNVDAFMENKRKRDQIIEDFLNDGWQIHEQIVCPPNVMLIFSREKETEENEREQ